MELIPIRRFGFAVSRFFQAVLGAALFSLVAAGAADPTITTDPLAAALMPPKKMGASMFTPSFMRPAGRIFSFELPLEPPPADRFPSPGLNSREPQAPNEVVLTTPTSNSIFPRNSVITFTWLPSEQEIVDSDPPTKPQTPIRYEIYISRHDQWTDRLFVKEHHPMPTYTYLFTPPGPGRYHWHVRAVYDRAMHGHNSEIRSFMVLP